jgi:hypothetical protein
MSLHPPRRTFFAVLTIDIAINLSIYWSFESFRARILDS